VDLVPVGIDPSYQVYANTAWAPLFSVLAGPLDVAGGGRDGWATAFELQRQDFRPAQLLTVGTAWAGIFTVTARSPGQVLFGAVPTGSWRVKANGAELAAHPAAGGATWWELPAGTDVIVIARAASTGQHLADVATVLIWAFAISATLSRLRKKLGSQLRRANFELGTPSEEVSEIDWSAVADTESLG
jgi:hypothetical protein